MATNIPIDNSKYVISLDSLDLSLLPSTYQKSFNIKPGSLWQKRNLVLNTEEYFEFEIHSVKESDELTNENCDRFEITDSHKINLRPNESHIFCHICMIAVPRPYINEHVRSSKHVSYQKIANTALEREKKQKTVLQNLKQKIRNKRNGFNYFCEHCVTIVELSDLEQHNNSNKHKNFTALDDFLSKFALFYTNTDENVDENLSETVYSKYNGPDINISVVKVNKYAESNVDTKVNEKDMNTLKDKTAIDTKLKEAVNLITNIESRIDNADKENNNTVTELTDTDDNKEASVVNSLRQYIKFLKKHGTVKLEPLNSDNQDHIKIVTNDGTELVVSVNNFHGFKRTGKKYVQCKLCKLFVSNVNDHIVSEKHVKRIVQPFEDQHCLRRLTDILSHCVVCNEVIDNPTVHILFNEHSKKLKQCLVPKVDTINTSIDKLSIEEDKQKLAPKIIKNDVIETISDTLCNEIENNLKDIIDDFIAKFSVKDSIKYTNEGESNKQSNYNQYFCSTCNKFMHVNNIETHVNGTKHIMNSKMANNYLMERCKNGLKCKICETDVQIYVWAVDDHIASPEHVTNYYKFLAENKINQTNDRFFCKPCEKVLPKMGELIHASTQSHNIKLASYNITYIAAMDHKKVKEKTEMAKDIKSSKYEGKDRNTIDINKPTSKLDKVSSTRNVSNGSTKDISNDTYQCEACNEIIANDPERIKLHNESAIHKTMDELLSKVNNSLEELLKYFNNPPETHYHLQRTDVEGELRCKICSDKIRIEDAEKHISSLSHIHTHRCLMETNKLKLKDDKYICYACNVYVDDGKELRHIDSEQHAERMEDLRNGDCVLVTVETKKLIEKISKDLKAVESFKGPPKAKDLEFDDFIPWNKRVDLKRNTGHYNHFSNLIDNNKELICVLCQVVVENLDEEIALHISHSNHNFNYNAVMSYNQIVQIKTGFVCGFCECTFIDNELGHIVNPKHIESYNNDPKKNFCFKCNVSTIDLDLKEHLTSPQHIEAINSETHSLHYCNVCDLKLTNNESNIQRHVDGFQHNNNCSLIEENRVILKNKKCFCQICEVSFNRECLDEHISSSYHIMLLDGNK